MVTTTILEEVRAGDLPSPASECEVYSRSLSVEGIQEKLLQDALRIEDTAAANFHMRLLMETGIDPVSIGSPTDGGSTDLEKIRAEWTEVRSDELFFIIGDYSLCGWEFSERSTFEVQWYPLKTTPDLIAKAKAVVEGKRRLR